MSRLILVPQYPTKLRYQEWWFTELPKQFREYFDEVLVLGNNQDMGIATFIDREAFSPLQEAVDFETQQINEYMSLTLQDNDVLLLNDISYPGLFANVLFHKRPKKCFAICHGTSRNRYDIFAKDRKQKWMVEKGTMGLFEKIFVATFYHKNKLGLAWNECTVQPFPEMPTKWFPLYEYVRLIGTVARPGMQKTTKSIEDIVEKKLDCVIGRCKAKSWDEYYSFLAESRILLITSKEETFGYQVLDAVANGCIPVAPNKYSYPELIPSQFLYNDTNELIRIIKTIWEHPNLTFPGLKTDEKSKNFYRNLSLFMHV